MRSGRVVVAGAVLAALGCGGGDDDDVAPVDAGPRQFRATTIDREHAAGGTKTVFSGHDEAVLQATTAAGEVVGGASPSSGEFTFDGVSDDGCVTIVVGVVGVYCAEHETDLGVDRLAWTTFSLYFDGTSTWSLSGLRPWQESDGLRLVGDYAFDGLVTEPAPDVGATAAELVVNRTFMPRLGIDEVVRLVQVGVGPDGSSQQVVAVAETTGDPFEAPIALALASPAPNRVVDVEAETADPPISVSAWSQPDRSFGVRYDRGVFDGRPERLPKGTPQRWSYTFFDPSFAAVGVGQVVAALPPIELPLVNLFTRTALLDDGPLVVADPDPPRDVVVAPAPGGTMVSWTPATDADGYRVTLFITEPDESALEYADLYTATPRALLPARWAREGRSFAVRVAAIRCPGWSIASPTRCGLPWTEATATSAVFTP